VRRPAGALAAGLLRALPGPAWGEPERAVGMFAAAGNWPHCYGILRNLWDSPRLRREIYGPRMLAADLPDAFGQLASDWTGGDDPVMAAADYEWRHKMVNDLLWQEDRCGMAQGLEVRVPYVDVRVAAHAQSMGRAQLMPGGRLKGHLREKLRAVLPAEILGRRKSGFQVHAPEFFRLHLQGLARHYLSRQAVEEYGLFNYAFVRDILRRGAGTGLRWHYFMLYFMLMTHLWVELFERGSTLSLDPDYLAGILSAGAAGD